MAKVIKSHIPGLMSNEFKLEVNDVWETTRALGNDASSQRTHIGRIITNVDNAESRQGKVTFIYETAAGERGEAESLVISFKNWIFANVASKNNTKLIRSKSIGQVKAKITGHGENVTLVSVTIPIEDAREPFVSKQEVPKTTWEREIELRGRELKLDFNVRILESQTVTLGRLMRSYLSYAQKIELVANDIEELFEELSNNGPVPLSL